MPKCPNTNTRSALSSIATRTSRRFFAGSGNASEPDGLRVFDLDAGNGAVREASRFENARGAIYFALSNDARFLYAAQAGAVVAAYAVEDGGLRLISEHPCLCGSTPCYVAVSRAGKAGNSGSAGDSGEPGEFVFFAEYAGATIGVFRAREDGSLEGPTHSLKHAGALGPNRMRQEAPHCHCIVQADDGWVFVCDLGLDRVVAYSFDAASGRLSPGADGTGFVAAPGAGPRHIVFEYCARSAYLLNELDSTLVVLSYKGAGVFEARQTLSTLPEGFAGESKAAAVKISPDGEWVLASNRGHDSIAAFRIGADGALAAPVISGLGGRFPRDFEFSPDGRFVVAGHKLSNEIAVYAFDHESGRLAQAGGAAVEMPMPLCFVFDAAGGAGEGSGAGDALKGGADA